MWDDAGLYDDSERYAQWNQPERKKRTVVRKKGETTRYYAHRTLKIQFPQTEAEWRKAKKKRMSAARKNRVYGFNSKADPFGLTSTQRRQMDYYLAQERKKDAARMGVEDMRALLKDEHWEEVCGHVRWKYDKKSTIKEFNRYQREHMGRY